jgi:hypothetical protein
VAAPGAGLTISPGCRTSRWARVSGHPKGRRPAAGPQVSSPSRPQIPHVNMGHVGLNLSKLVVMIRLDRATKAAVRADRCPGFRCQRGPPEGRNAQPWRSMEAPAALRHKRRDPPKILSGHILTGLGDRCILLCGWEAE